MKFTNQTIPPSLVQLYKDLISNDQIGVGANNRARTRRKNSLPVNPKRLSAARLALLKLIAFLAVLHSKASNSADDRQWRYQRARAILEGQIEPAFWVKAKVLTLEILQSTPSSVPYTGPRQYDYPDPLNLPTTPTYPPGNASSGNPAYQGVSAAGYFNDTSLKWLRKVWQLGAPIDAKKVGALLLKLTGTITIAASNRPSRAMASLNARIRISALGAPDTTDTSPPLKKSRRHYWRYRNQITAPPYYSATLTRSILQIISTFHTTGAAVTAAVATTPMEGIRYNNNTAIQTEWEGTADLYEPNLCFEPTPPASLFFTNGGTRKVANSTYPQGIAFTLAHLNQYKHSAEGTAPNRVAKPVSGTTISTDPAIWVSLSGSSPPSLSLVAPGATPPSILSGNVGEDRGSFTLTASALNFNSHPDRANPTDADQNNHYMTCATVTDSLAKKAFTLIDAEPLYTYRAVTQSSPDTRSFPAYSLAYICPLASDQWGYTKTLLGQLPGDPYNWMLSVVEAGISANWQLFRACLIGINPGWDFYVSAQSGLQSQSWINSITAWGRILTYRGFKDGQDIPMGSDYIPGAAYGPMTGYPPLWTKTLTPYTDTDSAPQYTYAQNGGTLSETSTILSPIAFAYP